MADDTPPVCLAAYAASAISRADPLKTGVQAFTYDMRTAILPFIFIFNPQLLLINVDNWWHIITIFFIALVAILCFSSATQGWMLVRLRWYEILGLILITWMLFLPNSAMNRIYPEFAPASLDEFSEGDLDLKQNQKLRIHITRETNYGDRYKLYVFEGNKIHEGAKSLGLKLEPEQDRFVVAGLDFMGPAEKVGINFFDYVTSVDIEQINRPAKELVYIPAFLLLILIILGQVRRLRVSGRQAK